jgi:hypothetical protein
MTTRHHERVRAALQRLTTGGPAAEPQLPPLPLLLRKPFLIASWALLLVILTAALALGRILVPHVENSR